MRPGEIYSLRMRLLAAGYTPIPCEDGQPVLTLYGVRLRGKFALGRRSIPMLRRRAFSKVGAWF
jgi:hypothetical protein